MIANPDSNVNQHLLSYLDVMTPELKNNIQPLSLRHKQPVHEVHGGRSISPFTSANLVISDIIIPLIIPLGKRYEYTWNAAVYLMSKNAPPIWYQLSLPLKKSHEVADFKELLHFERVSGKRPVISLS